MIRIIASLAILGVCSAVPLYYVQENAFQLQHPAVLANAAMEASLPDYLRNDFYKNPHIAASLAEPSWFGYKEGLVTDRESDKIPREKIHHILHNAGFVRR
ncbi:uncharacterized protein LOC106653122 [Trichogramma pretiosum]|uniref:uncharacterized protein LOC106653122 n=1 Tax=Trichogramma pretiosum TaxID=7493 RepID=UPI0006C968D2|nr:uncharacterized protein LOC106653122 [Trichogramma pretiosum]XP_014227865.1 uncharacterized protein LOC106653122 [Trichogramma pretiosum]